MSFDRKTNKPRRNDFGPVGSRPAGAPKEQGGARINHGTWQSRRSRPGQDGEEASFRRREGSPAGERGADSANRREGGSKPTSWRGKEYTGGSRSSSSGGFRRDSGDMPYRQPRSEGAGGDPAASRGKREYSGGSRSGREGGFRRESGNAPYSRRENSPAGGQNSARPADFKRTGGDQPHSAPMKSGESGGAPFKSREFKPSGGSGRYQKPFNRREGGDRTQFRGAPGPRVPKPAPRPGATDGMPARRLALDVIRKVTENGAYASLTLDEKLHGCTLSAADRRFAARLVYDTLDHIRELDWALKQVMAKPDTDIRLVNVLRLGACQLLLDYHVPENAATDTSVRLCREIGLEGLAGVCNGILRNLIRQKDSLTRPEPGTDLALSVETGAPEWLVRRLRDDWGQETAEQLLRWRDKRGGLVLRPNLTRLDDAGFEALLEKKVWEREPALLPHAVRVRGTLDITGDADWTAGLYSIQSEGSQCAVLALDVKPGWKVLDCCAAPGGKTCYIAELLKGGGRVQAWDKHAHRVELIAAQARRLRLENIRPMERDAAVRRPDLDMEFDAVLLDAPCSGTGDMAEKPDIKLRLKEENLQSLLETQAQLLDSVCEAVKVGGVLVYATCSLLKAENEEQVRAFLSRHPNFVSEKLPASVPASLREHEDLGLQLMAHRDGVGGFYVCRMKRIEA